MSLNASYAPKDTPAQYADEVTRLTGNTVLCGFSYGIFFTLYILCMDALLPQLTKPQNQAQAQNRRDRSWAIFHIVYATCILLLNGTGTAFNARSSQLFWIDNRNYPGGPARFIEQELNLSERVSSWAVFVGASWLQDAYVVYRCLVFWDWNPAAWSLFLILAASIGTSIALIIETASPTQGVSGHLTLDLAICWYVFSVSINVLATLAIVGRLLWKRREINSILGKEYSRSYTGVVAMLVESAALYSVFGVIFIGCYFRGNPAGNLILPVLGNLEGISPIMIIYRVAIGRGWTHKTLKQVNSTFAVSTMRFHVPEAAIIHGNFSTAGQSQSQSTATGGFSKKANNNSASDSDVESNLKMHSELRDGVQVFPRCSRDIVVSEQSPCAV